MNLLLKHAETGVFIPCVNIQISSTVAQIQEKIKNEFKIDVPDQILITNKGVKLKSDDVLQNIDNENCFQSTVYLKENAQKPYNTIYIFQEKNLMSSGSESTTQLKENCQKHFVEQFDRNDIPTSYLIENRIIQQDFQYNFEQNYQELSQQESFQIIFKEHLPLEKRMYTSFQVLKNKFMQYQSKKQKIENLIIECENQIQSTEAIFRWLYQHYQLAKGKQTDVVNRRKLLLEKNGIIIRKFEESIDNLKKIQLHENLKTSKQQVLMDIYYAEEEMIKWKNSCQQTQQQIVNRTDKIVSHIKNAKKKIKEEKTNSWTNILPILTSQKVSFETFINENEVVMLSILQNSYDDYKNLRQNMEILLEDKSNENALIFMNQIQTIFKSDSTELVKSTIEIIDNLNKIGKSFQQIKMNQIEIVNYLSKVIHKFICDLMVIGNEKIKHLMDEMEKIEKDFSYLLNPSHLPIAYQNALSEVSRRREFYQVFEQKYKKLAVMSELEKDRRKKFLQNYGRILPIDFIPQLKNLAPILTINNLNIDQDLPKIEGYHGNDCGYLKKNKKFGKNDDNDDIQKIQKENEDLSKLLAKTHMYYKDIPDFRCNLSQLNGESEITKELTQKIQILSDLICETSCQTFNSYMRKLKNKQKEANDIKQSYESQLMRLEEKYTKQNTQFEELLSKQKQSHQDMLTNIHNLNKQELEKLQQKKKLQDTDSQNRQTEIDKLNSQMKSLQRDLRVKSDEIQQMQKELDTSKHMNVKLKEDIQKIQNKSENQEIITFNKQTEIGNLQKQLKQYEVKMQQLQNEISNQNNNYEDSLKKINQLNERNQQIVAEREKLQKSFEKANKQNSTDSDKITEQQQQIAEKVREVEMLKKQLEIFNQQIDKCEQAEKSKNVEIQHNLNQKQIEIAELNVKLKKLQIEIQEKNNYQDQIKNELKQEQTKLVEIQANNEDLDKEIKDIKLVYEQICIENQIQNQTLSQQQKELQENIFKIKQLQQEVQNEKEQGQQKLDDLLQEKLIKIRMLEKEIQLFQDKLAKQEQLQQEKENEMKKNIQILEENLENQNKQIHEQENYQILNSNFVTIKTQLEQLQNENKQLLLKLNDHENNNPIEDYENQIKDLKKTIWNQNKKIESLENVQKEIEIISLEKDCLLQRLDQAESNMILNQTNQTNESSTRMNCQELQDMIQSKDNSILLYNQNTHVDVKDIIKAHLQYNDVLDYTLLEIGLKTIFIPVFPGIYSPLLLTQFTQKNHTYKNVSFLQIDSLNNKYKNLLSECSLIVIAKIKKIDIIKLQINNKFFLKEGEEVQMITIDNPDFIIGFEEDDCQIKNYI